MLPDIDRLLVLEANASELEGEQPQTLDKLESAINDARGKDPAHILELRLSLIRFLILKADYPQALIQIDKAFLVSHQPIRKIGTAPLTGSMPCAHRIVDASRGISVRGCRHQPQAKRLDWAGAFVISIGKLRAGHPWQIQPGIDLY